MREFQIFLDQKHAAFSSALKMTRKFSDFQVKIRHRGRKIGFWITNRLPHKSYEGRIFLSLLDEKNTYTNPTEKPHLNLSFNDLSPESISRPRWGLSRVFNWSIATSCRESERALTWLSCEQDDQRRRYLSPFSALWCRMCSSTEDRCSPPLSSPYFSPTRPPPLNEIKEGLVYLLPV